MTIGPTFFDSIRASLFGGSLSQPQVDGMIAIAEEWERSGDGDGRKLAYIFATTFHETAETMQPIAEIGHGKGRTYGEIDISGKAPYGRGFVQLTFRDNYIKADAKLGLGGRLEKDYDLAMSVPIAAKIIVRGMLEGWFTGKKLGDYFPAIVERPADARAIVNGTDRAAVIAGYYVKFKTAIRGVAVHDVSPVTRPAQVPTTPTVPDVHPNVAVGTGAVAGVGAAAAVAGGAPWPYVLGGVILAAVIVAGVVFYLKRRK